MPFLFAVFNVFFGAHCTVFLSAPWFIKKAYSYIIFFFKTHLIGNIWYLEDI